MASKFNSHKHKKFNRYTAAPSRKKGFSPYLIILFTALAAIITALLLGTLLGDLADTAPNNSGTATDLPQKEESPDLLDCDEIKGAFVTLAGVFDSTAENVRAQIPDGAEAVSMTLFDPNGDPYYHSKVAEAFGKKSGDLTLSRAFEGISAADGALYASVIFPSSALNNSDQAKQAVLNAYEASLIEELMLAGADDVIITPFALGEIDYELGEGFAEKLQAYVISVRAIAPSIRIGLALPPEYLSDSEHSLLIESISKMVDFLAIDLTSSVEIDSFTSAISDASVNILRRSVRILLTQTSDSELKILTDLLDKYSMENYQVAKKP